MATTSDLKNGIIIKFNNDLHQVLQVEHRTPGNLRAFYQVKMRNLRNGKMIDNRFRSGEEITVERLEQKVYQYLYKDNTEYYFMENETYDQIHLLEDIVGEQGEFLKAGQEVQIVFHNGKALSLVLPPHIVLQVTSAPPAVKGNTSTNATKTVTLETGAEVNVPLFIDEGEFIKIDIRTREYLERVKK
ncbi:MAG: elongation factor P [Ignavibacteria bacterium]